MTYQSLERLKDSELLDEDLKRSKKLKMHYRLP